ncbi:hypothetical protein CFAEC_09900 [Corynebacterium faecale]|uniref:hypothetical protein n=1 Tax=Corynebacterium faecale TaxID=1758466 RepID=UPI0025B4F6B8|nr:hypothetical protein [Corynebacterium faecale]WJY92793.1 hypothetical protein CFAEC_09900 [Corynebacterium faecale]
MDIVIRGTFHDRQDFFGLIGRAAWGLERPSPTNFDGLADLIRETHLQKITVHGSWAVEKKTTSTLHRICEDLGVSLRLPGDLNHAG